MKRLLSFLIVAFCVFLPLCVFAQEDQQRIAIFKFNSSNRIQNWWSIYDWGHNFDPGEAISAALTSKMGNSPKFILIERENIDKVLAEQINGATGLISPETAAEQGKLLGAKYIVLGTVTEFNLTDLGSQGGIRAPISGFGFGMRAKANKKVRVSCEAKVVDTTTGAIVYTASSREDVSVGDGGMGVAYRGYGASGKGGELPSSALGNGIYKVAENIAKQLNEGEFKKIAAMAPIEGYVIAVDGNTVFLNLTSADKVVKNMKFKISMKGKVTDPVTGQVKQITKTVGEVKVIDVTNETTECEIITTKSPIKPGDRAVRI